MRSHHVSRAVLASAVVMFFVSLDVFAQYQGTGAVGGTGANGFPASFGSAAATTTEAAPATSSQTVQAADLTAAGFTDPVAVTSTATGFLPPVSYFRTKETVVSVHPEWGGAADLVAVSVTAIADRSWSYNGGQMQIVDLSGRTQARVSKPGVYVVVTGPDANKVAALANIVKAK